MLNIPVEKRLKTEKKLQLESKLIETEDDFRNHQTFQQCMKEKERLGETFANVISLSDKSDTFTSTH